MLFAIIATRSSGLSLERDKKNVAAAAVGVVVAVAVAFALLTSNLHIFWSLLRLKVAEAIASAKTNRDMSTIA